MGVSVSALDVDVLVDITEQAEKRLQAELAFKSQGHTEPFARKRMEIGIGQYGWYAGVGYAEAFIRARTPVVTYLTVSEHERRRAESSTHELLRQMSRMIP